MANPVYANGKVVDDDPDTDAGTASTLLPTTESLRHQYIRDEVPDVVGGDRRRAAPHFRRGGRTTRSPATDLPHTGTANRPPGPPCCTDDEGTLISAYVLGWTTRERKARRARPNRQPGEYVHKHLYRMVQECRAGGVADVVALYRPVVEACGELGLDAERVWAKVVDRWDTVRVTDRSADALSRAMWAAGERPVYLPEGIRRRFPDSLAPLRVLASVAYHLQALAPGQWVPFGSERLAGHLGRHRQTVDSWVKALESAGVLAVLRDQDGMTVWDDKAKQARMVKYTGMPPDDL